MQMHRSPPRKGRRHQVFQPQGSCQTAHGQGWGTRALQAAPDTHLLLRLPQSSSKLCLDLSSPRDLACAFPPRRCPWVEAQR